MSKSNDAPVPAVNTADDSSDDDGTDMMALVADDFESQIVWTSEDAQKKASCFPMLLSPLTTFS